MLDFSLILSHPLNEEIISKLLSGISSKDVHQWLQLKYPDDNQSHLIISNTILNEFSQSQYIDLYSQFKKDLNTVSKSKKDKSASLVGTKTYKETLEQIASKELNILETFSNLIKIANLRLEQVYDKVQENPSSTKNDRNLVNWFEKVINSLEKFEKLRLQAIDPISQHNITIQAVEQHIAVFQDAIRETFKEIDPGAASIFWEKLNIKLKETRIEKPLTQDERLKEATVLQERLLTD